MERLVVLRPEHADLSREFSSSFVLRDLVDLMKRVANSWRRMAVRVRAIAVLLVCWRNASIFLARLSSFSKSDRSGSLSPLGSREIAAGPKSDFNSQGRWMCQTEIVWHISLIAAARSALRLQSRFGEW